MDQKILYNLIDIVISQIFFSLAIYYISTSEQFYISHYLFNFAFLGVLFSFAIFGFQFGMLIMYKYHENIKIQILQIIIALIFIILSYHFAFTTANIFYNAIKLYLPKLPIPYNIVYP